MTGAARGLGQGICHALATAGADVIATDLADLDETAAAVKDLGRRVVARPSDVRDQASLDDVVREGVDELGGLDIIVANAGISTWSKFWEMPEDQWQTMIDVNLTGVWRTFKAGTPTLLEQDRGGSLIAISSVAGLKALPGQAHYSSAKHGVVGLVRSAAIELGPHQIRVNSVHPWGINTRLAEDPEVFEMLEANPTYAGSFGSILPSPMPGRAERHRQRGRAGSRPTRPAVSPASSCRSTWARRRCERRCPMRSARRARAYHLGNRSKEPLNEREGPIGRRRRPGARAEDRGTRGLTPAASDRPRASSRRATRFLPRAPSWSTSACHARPCGRRSGSSNRRRSSAFGAGPAAGRASTPPTVTSPPATPGSCSSSGERPSPTSTRRGRRSSSPRSERWRTGGPTRC